MVRGRGTRRWAGAVGIAVAVLVSTTPVTPSTAATSARMLAEQSEPAPPEPAPPEPVTVGPGPIGDTPPPPAEPPRPADPTVRSGGCVQTAGGDGADTDGSGEPTSWAQEQLGYTEAWAFARGAGQRVAVIDTGVNPNPRLRVVAGGDYVNGPERGTVDCDAHGSIVASIIGAAPDGAQDGYAGVAPEAEIFSVRQYSSLYTYADPVRATASPGGYGDVVSLARAVVWAADQGSTVINISEAACGPAGEPLAADEVLGAALRYAVDERDVVVVVAAGNAPSEECGPGNDPTGARPPVVAVSPAWWDEYVLTVGSTNADGTPSEFSLAGPWVDVAAPGTEIVSLNPVPGPSLVNRLVGAGGEASTIQGTSFSTPYVSGTAALVRQRFPDLDARQVMARIKATAHSPGGGRNMQVGHGVVDPLAAVTDVLPADVTPAVVDGASAPVPRVAPAPEPARAPRVVAVVGSAAALGALALTFLGIDVLRRARARPGRRVEEPTPG